MTLNLNYSRRKVFSNVYFVRYYDLLIFDQRMSGKSNKS